jgi:hypothetical protein
VKARVIDFLSFELRLDAEDGSLTAIRNFSRIERWQSECRVKCCGMSKSFGECVRYRDFCARSGTHRTSVLIVRDSLRLRKQRSRGNDQKTYENYWDDGAVTSIHGLFSLRATTASEDLP